MNHEDLLLWACACTVCIQVCEHVCLCCCFPSLQWLRITCGLWTEEGPLWGVIFVRLVLLICSWFSPVGSNWQNELRSNDVPLMCDTATDVSCGETVLTTTCLSVYHLITPGCIIGACLNIYTKNFGHTVISWPWGEKQKVVHVEDTGWFALSVNCNKPRALGPLLATD